MEVSIGCDDYYVALAFRRSEHNGGIVTWLVGCTVHERLWHEKGGDQLIGGKDEI